MSDLTRWNRAGLECFRYVDGNAVTYLEMLRAALRDGFPKDANSPPRWEQLDAPQQESDEQRSVRMLRQYREGRGDWGWEIARAFSRACHVLTEHLDACANEAYLGTATQWDSVRKLVGMLGYRPHPPASAATPLVLLAKENLKGKVAKGFAVKFSPPEGGSPVTFETLADFEVNSKLNALRPRDYARSQKIASGSMLTLERIVEGLRIGEPIVIENETTGFIVARLIAEVEIKDGVSIVHVSPPIASNSDLRSGYLRVHLRPAEVLPVLGPAMPGANAQMLDKSLHLEEPPIGLQAGNIVHITDGKNHYFRRVVAVEDHRIVFDQTLGSLQLQDATVSRAREVSVASVPGRKEINLFVVRIAGDFGDLAGKKVADNVGPKGRRVLAEFPVVSAKYVPLDATGSPLPTNKGYSAVSVDDKTRLLTNPQTLFIPPAVREWKVDSFLRNDIDKPFPNRIDTGAPKKLAVGDVAVVASANNLAWGKITSVALDQERHVGNVSVARWFSAGGGRYYLKASRAFGHFKERARLAEWNLNDAPLSGDTIVLDAPVDEQVLPPGRALIIEPADTSSFLKPLTAQVKNYDATSGMLILDRSLAAADGFTVGTAVIRANVVTAGHGEARPDRVLGSGEATRSNQTFVFKVAGVSFVADPAQSSGVRADIEVRVDGRAWKQVSNLQDSTAADLHYSVRMTEEGYLLIEFGDGVNGRRLPSGENNVRIVHRVGSGLAGNLAPGSLVKPVHPHPLIESVRQPVASSGGNDMESTASLRAAAPATVLTLERAVALEDFAYLAAANSSIWRARALPRPSSHRKRAAVEVVVVPAGGAPLGPLATTIASYLSVHALPEVKVYVTEFERVLMRLRATIRVDGSQFDAEAVERKVRVALIEAFALRQRGIGQPVYLSDVYRVVEAVQGVENSDCAFLDASGRPLAERVLRCSERQVLFIDAAVAAPVIEHQEFAL